MTGLTSSPEYVNAGSLITWTGQFGSFVFTSSVQDAIANVSAYLKNNYNLIVQSSSFSLSGTTASATLNLITNIDRGDGETDDGLTDILNNINDAFASSSSSGLGYAVSASALTSYTPAQQDGSLSTGAPIQNSSTAVQNAQTAALNAAAAAAAAGPLLGAGTSWFSGLETNLEAGGIGLIIGAAAVVGLIIYMSVKP